MIIQSWENLDLTWGVKNYNPAAYLNTQWVNSQRLKIWVVDTWIDHWHADLKENTNTSIDYDFVNNDDDAMDDQWHGTHVAGTIGAQNNGSWIVWVNPNVDLIGLKICNYRGYCPSYAVIKVLGYATEKKIDVLNMSLWGKGTPLWHPICDAITSYTKAG
jgi:subtilisin family serine protease